MPVVTWNLIDRWKAREDEMPLAYPYVEFKRGLVLEIEPLN